MSEIQEKINAIMDEMARTQKNKATAYHIGTQKAKQAKQRRELITPKGGGGKPGEGFDVSKTGDARVGMIGFPSVGKSTLQTKQTSTFSEIAAYEFTTQTCIPGTFQYKGCKIQQLDLPGIIEGAKDGKGRGRQVIAVARTCSLILICLDASKPLTHKKIIEREQEGFGIRINKKKPDISIKKREKGGINLVTTLKLTHLDKDLVTTILREYRISNAEVIVRFDATVDEFIDVVEANRVYIPALYVLNKIDAITIEELDLLSKVPHYVPICAEKLWNLDELQEKIWEYLNMIRVYTKPRGQIPNYSSPVVLPSKQCTIEDFCKHIHKSMMDNFKYARVWGSSVKHNPQKVGKDHILMDEDVVQIIKRV